MATINVRMNDDTKKKAEEVFAKLGITPSAAINLFYNQVIITNGIPFSLKIYSPNETTKLAIREIEQSKKNPATYRAFDSVDDLMEDLLDEVPDQEN